MLKSITTKLINKFLKEYIIIDEDKNLLVQSWNGNVNLKKIELVQKYYHNFSVRGMIEDLRLVIPWKNFLNGYVTIEASNVDIYIESYDIQQNLSKLAVNNSESISSDDKKEKKKMSFFLRKLLEKLLIKVENLTIYYRKYRLKVNMISINDKKEINIESISLEMNSNETYIKKIMPFDFRGKISDNSINAYVDCVDVLVRRRDIVEITCDMLDLYKEILQVSEEHDEMYKVASSKRDVNASEKELHGDHLLPKIDGENKIEQELEGDTKRIINLDEEIKICLVMDKLKLKIIKETRKGLIKVLKYRILDLKLEHRNSTNLNFRLDSSTVRLFYNMENDRITVSEIYVNTIKIMKRLGYRLRNKLDLTVSCSEIGIDKKRCALKGFRLKGKDVCFEIPFFWMHSAAELIFTKISEINISADVCKLLMFVKTHIELTKGNRFLKKITNRLGTRSDTKMPWVIFCLQSCIMNTSLFVGNFSVIPGCIDKNIEELEQLATGGKQLISDDTQGYVIKSDTIRWYEHEKHDICVTLVDSAVPISRFHFGNFTIDEIKKCTNGYCVGRVQYKKTQLDNFVITFEDIIKVEIDKIVIHNEYDLVQTIYGIKNVVYSFITDQFSSPTKDPGKDVEICIKKITYYHKSMFEIECLLFKNDTLTLRVLSGGLAVHINLGISDTEVKVDLKVEGAVDTAEYNSILYCIIEFIDILITILDNSYEGKTKSKMVLINADAKMLLRGVVCARSAHCAEECYRLTTSASVVILGENITVTVEKGFLTAINQSTGHSDTLSILNKSFDKNNSIIGESTGLLEHEVVVNDLKVKIKKIEYGMNLDVSVSEIHNSILLHQVLILKEYYLLPQLGIIGTALRLNYTIKIGKIRCDLSYNSRVKLDITSLCIENDTTKFDVEYGGIDARINIKTTYDVVNTLKISTNNVIVKNEVEDYEMYHKLLQTLLDESNTNFTSGRYTQVNLIVKGSELYLNRSKPQDEDTSYFVETMPLLMFQIEKLIFFSPTTGSLRFSGYIFNPKILEYELLFEPASIVVAMLGNKITVKCSDLRLNIAKETFQTFSFDHKDCIIQLENIMSSLGVFLRAGHHEKYDLDVVPDDNDDEHNVCVSETRTGNIKSVSGLEHEGHKNENAGSSQARHRRIASESAGPGPVLHQDIFKKKFNALNSHDTKMSDIMVGPLTGAIIHKKFYSKKLDLTVNNQKITIDLTKEEKHHVMNSFVFTKIHNFNRYIRVFNHVYFKNCLPYELDLLLGDDDVQEEELVLKNDLSFNTSHMYLRIRMGNKISADSFMFQKGVYKADDDNVTLFLDERSILIERKVINLLSYVENISGNLVYYVFFLPNSYIVNKTRRNLNICLEGNFFTRELVLEPEEIIAADCWRFKDRIGIKSPIDDFMSVSNAFLSKNQCTQMQAADERIKHDFIISHKSPAEHSSILLTRKKLSIRILRNIFRVFNLYVLNFRFTVMNSIDEKIYIDDERLSKGVTERDITRGTVLINNKLRVFDFNVLNILKELEHKYLLSMETRNETIDVGSKLEIVDQDNVASPHEVQFEQKVVEIKYSYVIENKTRTGLMVNDTFFANNEHKPIEMHKKNVLKINDMHINMIVCPYFRIRDSFYTIITKIREKQKIMRLEASDAPIEIHNNTETVVCVNKKYFLNPGDKFDYVYDNYKELKIDFEANMEGKLIKLKRKYGRTVCADNFKVASMNRGAKEYIYLGATPTNVHFEDVFVILINSLTISLFENNCEFVNLYLRDLEAVKQIDTLKNLFTYAVSIRGMQIDNQCHSPAFPIILSPVYPMFYYYNNTASADDGHFMIYKCEINGNLFHRDERTPDSRTLSFNYIIFAVHEFELSIEEEVLTRLFMWLPKGKGDTALFCTLLHIHPINLRLNLLMSKKKHFIHKLIGFLVSNLSEVRLSFTTLIFSQFEYNNDLLINAYKMQMLSQIFNLIGGLDLLGNLSSLVEELSLGVHDLFYEPYVGLKHDDLFMFTKGILKGGKNFVTYCISGLTSTVGKVGRSISRSSSNKRLLFYDELEIDVTKDLIENVVDGLSGIITKPVKGAKKGVKGFLKGVGSGLKGALMKPIAGISEFAANISDNIKTNMNGAELRRIQYPRYKLEKYNLDLCQAYFLFDIYKNKDMQPIDSGAQRHLKVCNEQFVGGGKGKVYDMKVHVIVTSQRLLMISHQANLHINSFDVVMGGIKVKDWIVELDDETMSYVRTLK